MPELQSYQIPDHLIVDNILPRLPVKPLIRFKSVSKLWHSVISSTKFVKSHLNSYLPSSNQCLLLTAPRKLLLLTCDESNNLKPPVPMDFNLAPYLKRQCYINFAGYCNGLFCLYYSTSLIKAKGFFSVCNPALHQFLKVEHPSYETIWPVVSWFGYVPSIDDYKIVAVFRCGNHANAADNVDKKIYVFSLRTRKWKRRCDFDLVDMVFNRIGHKTVIDDTLYWSHSYKGWQQRPMRIVGFNLVNDTLKEVPWMDWLSRYCGADFFVMNGCLSLLCSSHDPVSDVWILKQHDDWSSWEMVYSVDVRGVIVISATTSGKLLVRDYNKECHDFSYQCRILDLSDKDGQERSQGDAYNTNSRIRGGAGYFVESLISPFGTNTLAEEENHQV